MSVDSGDGHSEQWNLVPQLRGDDPRELAFLYDNYAAYLFDYCEDVLQDADAAADAVRDTLVAAYTSVGAVADQGQLRSWLYAIARRQWPAYSQQQPASRPPRDGAQLPRPVTGPDFATGEEHSADQQATADQPETADQRETAGELGDDGQDEDAGWHGQAGEHPYPAEPRSVAPGPAEQAPPADPAHPAGLAEPAADLASGLSASAAAGGPADPAELARYDTDEFAALTPDEEENEEREARERETMTVVTAAFDGLAGPDREVLNLAYRHGIIGTDLAVTLGVPDRQVRARLTDAVSHFSQAADVIIILYLGWTRCRALEEIAGDWNPASARLEHELLTALTRHAARCQRCRHSSGYTVYGPELLASIPLTMPPDGLRRQVIDVAHDAGLDEYRAEVVARLGPLGADGFPLPPGSRRLGSPAPRPGGQRQASRADRPRRRRPLAAAAFSAVAAAIIVAGFLVFRLITASGPGTAPPPVPLQAADASPGSQLASSAGPTPAQAAGHRPRSSPASPPGLTGPTQPVIPVLPVLPTLPQPRPSQSPSPRHSPSPGHSKSPQPTPTIPDSSPPPSPAPTPTPTPSP